MDKVKKEGISRIRTTKEDKEIEKNDNMSIVLIILLLIICFIVGIGVGYILYNISISGSI